MAPFPEKRGRVEYSSPVNILNSVELNGINFISERERKGMARSLFWPWAAGNVSLLALSYGSFFLGFGILSLIHI